MLSFTVRIVATSTAVAVALFTASCSSHSSRHADEPVIGGEPATNNADDVSFANHVIPCQQQGLEMDQLATDHADNPQIAAFAGKNASTLQSDMQVLKALRAQWHGDKDDAGTSDAAGESHGAIDDGTITKLDSLRGKAFDVLWLNSMISLDQAVVRLANVEISTGKNPDAIGSARNLTESMPIDIGHLQQMLSR